MDISTLVDQISGEGKEMDVTAPFVHGIYFIKLSEIWRRRNKVMYHCESVTSPAEDRYQWRLGVVEGSRKVEL